MTRLWRAAGRFTKRRGSDDIIRFQQFPLNLVREATELHEVLLFRKLRGGIADGTLSDIKSEGMSFYLFVGSVLQKLMDQGFIGTHITHANALLGPDIEALKLIRQSRIERDLWIDAWCPSQKTAKAFRALHEDFDRLRSNIKIEAVKVGSFDQSLPALSPSDLVLVDLLRESSAELWPVLERHFVAAGTASVARMLLVARVSLQGGVAVSDVASRQYELPTLHQIAEWCEQHSLVAFSQYLEDFDRDYLLPFEGAYGVALIFVTPHAEDQFDELDFRRLRPFSHSSGMQLVAASQIGRPRNYNQLFQQPAPLLDSYREPNWEQWRNERDWDCSAVTFRHGNYPGDPWVHLYQLPNFPRAAKIARQIATTRQKGYGLSVLGLGHAAYLLSRTDGVLSLHCLLHALHISDYDAEIARALFHHVIWRAGVPIQMGFPKPGVANFRAIVIARLVLGLIDARWLALNVSFDAIRDILPMTYPNDEPARGFAEEIIRRAFERARQTAPMPTSSATPLR